jgi:hypothetical protein
MDADAAAYISAVETADTESLESFVKNAINNFVVGCKADSIWTPLKASCLLAGPRTLAGALVPLVGTAPTNVGGNFVAGDYNRLTGLKGNGTDKYLSTNRAGNADPQNDFHLSVYATEFNAVTQWLIGNAQTTFGASNLGYFSGNTFFRNRSSLANNIAGNAIGLVGCSRSSSSEFSARTGQSTQLFARVSDTANSSTLSVFNSGTDSANRSNARLTFYSVGTSVDLAKLETRIASYLFAIANPPEGGNAIDRRKRLLRMRSWR